MKAIGGYFELELNDYRTVYHDDAVALNNGRNALEYILRLQNNYKKVYLPYYICDVILQPIRRLNLEFDFYHINEEFIPLLKKMKDNEVLIFVNYFGVLNNKVKNIVKKFINVFIDNSQAFFDKPIKSIPTFYSPRKFFGLPDGGFAYSNIKFDLKLERDKSIDRFEHLLKRIEEGPEAGFSLFKRNDAKIDNLALRKMSVITERLLRNINFTNALQRRNQNFLFLHKHLKELNELTPIIENERINGPMVYPFLRKGNNRLREYLINNKLFVATYWPNVYSWTSKKSWEYYLTNNLIPLPIDQRYGEIEMFSTLKCLEEFL
ncbi:MAG: hypothetical protein ACTSQP_24420 [Promethearchaeota archaeon]